MDFSTSHRTFAWFMVFLLMVTSTGFTMSIHYCGGELRDIAIFDEDVECSMMASVKEKPACHTQALKSMNCCENQDISIDASSHESFIIKSLLVQPDWAPAILPAPIEFAPPVISEQLLSANPYRPPPIDRDIFVLVQSFLL